MKLDRESYEMHGPVRSVRTEGVALVDSLSQERIGNHWIDEELVFDTQGKLIERASADHHIYQEPFRFVYTYDEDGRTTESKGYNEDGVDAGATFYTYDSNGNKTEETYYYPGRQGKRRMLYDQRGNLIESACYLPDDTIITRDTWAYTYKVEENKVEEEFWHKHENYSQVPDENRLPYTDYFAFGLTKGHAATSVDNETGTWHKRVIIYDADGHIIEKIEYNADGTWDRKEKYDAEDRLTEKLYNGLDEDKTTYSYNERGQLIEINQVKGPDAFSQEPINRKCFYTYDEIGNLTLGVVYNADGSLYDKETYAYEYDSHGNWTRKTKTWVMNAGYKSVTDSTRIISYY